MPKHAGVFTPQDLDINPAECVSMDFGRNAVTGAPQPRLLYIGCNEIAEMEELFGASLASVFADPKQRGKLGTTINILWVALKVFDPDLSKQDVGRILSKEIGNMGHLWEKIMDALRKGVPGMFPTKKDKPADDTEAQEQAPLAPAADAPNANSP